MSEKTRTIVLVIIIAAAAGFIWYINSQYSSNFVNQF